MRIPALALLLTLCAAMPVAAATTIRILPPGGSTLAAGQRIDIYVDARGEATAPPSGLRVWIAGQEVTGRNQVRGEVPPGRAVFLLRNFSTTTTGPLLIRATTADGATAVATVTVEEWRTPRPGAARARNIILLLGDGMGLAHRTAARIVSRGVQDGRARGRLAMDTLDVTGLVMTSSLNAVITDSSPGMAAYVTGQKSNNNQQGVFPDHTTDAFDNPRVEYLGELLRRQRGSGFNVGIVSTADLTDSTPAANAVHTSNRSAGAGIAARFFDERETNGVTVLLGGGARHFDPAAPLTTRRDGRDLVAQYGEAGYTVARTATDVRGLLEQPRPPRRLLGLFHPQHMPVAFDKIGAGTYSDELAQPQHEGYRDQPMLDDLARLAIRTLSAHSPDGFYLMIEGASIDKLAHGVDADRMVWDVIEFDRAVQVALDFAAQTNGDADPANDTLVIVTADHETGGTSIVGVGNERFAPKTYGRGTRDYAAVYRFQQEQVLDFSTNYTTDAKGFPADPDPSRKLLIGFGAAPDYYENWLANRVLVTPAIVGKTTSGRPVTVPNPNRDANDPIPGFLVTGVIENGLSRCPTPEGCPADTGSLALTSAGHTASDVPLSATGPGAWQFTGVFENTDVFIKMLRAAAGSYAR